MGAAALPIIAGVGAVGGLIQGEKARKQADKALDIQKEQAGGQAALFDATSPIYQELLKALRDYAGFQTYQAPKPGLPGQLISGVGAPGSQLPYTNVTQQQLGVYANPTDALRFRASEDQTNTAARQALRQFSFDQGQRGLFGSSLDAAGRAAILAGALQQKSEFARNLAINAPSEYAQRLALLANALNPGLSAGPTAAGIAGSIAGTQAGIAGQAGAGVASTLQNYLLAQAMKNAQRPVGTTVPFVPTVSTPSYIPAGTLPAYVSPVSFF